MALRADFDGRLAQHTRAWLSPSWGVHLTSPLAPPARAALVDWFARGRPAMVRRRDPGDGPGVALCVTLPASRWLASIRFTTGRVAVARMAPPASLAEVIPGAPPGWHRSLLDLDRAATDAGVPLSVTGPLAWQHVTGEPYVSDRSSVDLLLRPRTRLQLEKVMALLRVREDGDGPRLDGEVHLGWDGAVSWRDLASGRRRVLVRGIEREAIVEVERLLSVLR
jgi:phosphoribosyl-dephospho-CoA transferase